MTKRLRLAGVLTFLLGTCAGPPLAFAQDSVRVCALVKPHGTAKGWSRDTLPNGKSHRLSQASVDTIAGVMERHRFKAHRAFTIAPLVCGSVVRSDSAHLAQAEAVDSLYLDTADAPTWFAESVPGGVVNVRGTLPDTVDGRRQTVGIGDSGADSLHEDLVPISGVDETGQGSWADNISACNGHGTHVAGTVGARHNSVGVLGVASGAQLVALKVFSNFNGGCAAFSSSQVAAIQYAVDHHFAALNFSLGSVGQCDAGRNQAIQNAAAVGMYTFVATGNDGGAVNVPANCTHAFAIGSHNGTTISGFSSWGPEGCVLAPGEGITSTMPGNTYGGKSGTSMATPHMTGVAALLKQLRPSVTEAQLRGAVCQGKVPFVMATALGRLVDPLAVSKLTADVSQHADTVLVSAVVPWCAASLRGKTTIVKLSDRVILSAHGTGTDTVTVRTC